MNIWQLIIQGLPASGEFKSIYSRQRRSREEVKEREAMLKRKRYRTRTGKAKQLAANANYKQRYIAEHGLDAWRERERAYMRAHRARQREKKLD